MTNRYLTSYIQCEDFRSLNDEIYHRRYLLGKQNTIKAERYDLGGSVWFDLRDNRWKGFLMNKDGESKTINYIGNSLEESKTKLDQMLIEEGYILLTEEQTQKFELLI